MCSSFPARRRNTAKMNMKSAYCVITVKIKIKENILEEKAPCTKTILPQAFVNMYRTLQHVRPSAQLLLATKRFNSAAARYAAFFS